MLPRKPQPLTQARNIIRSAQSEDVLGRDGIEEPAVHQVLEDNSAKRTVRCWSEKKPRCTSIPPESRLQAFADSWRNTVISLSFPLKANISNCAAARRFTRNIPPTTELHARTAGIEESPPVLSTRLTGVYQVPTEQQPGDARHAHLNRDVTTIFNLR
jgi:hypothetical protein